LATGFQKDPVFQLENGIFFFKYGGDADGDIRRIAAIHDRRTV